MPEYEHWRNLTDNTRLRAEVFQPKEKKVLTIKEIRKEVLDDGKGNKDTKPVAYFEEDCLPLVLNVTNCKTIEKLYDSGNIYDWIGKKIQVFATKTKVAGEMVPCIRVENIVPKSNEVSYLCCVCGKPISKAIYDGSVAKYGKPYCSAECHEKDTKGEKLL